MTALSMLFLRHILLIHQFQMNIIKAKGRAVAKGTLRKPVDQQWESQLINDTKFTANTPLPSLTLDVNNSYEARIIYEEEDEL